MKNIFKKLKIHRLCLKYGIKNYTINDDLSVDVNNNVVFVNRSFSKIPIKFNEVMGCFYCIDTNLNTFTNMPKKIEGLSFTYGVSFLSFNILINDNPIDILWKLFLNPKYIEYFNELGIVQDNGRVVILERLNYFLTDIGETEINKNDAIFNSIKEYYKIYEN